ncbi:MAG: SDR family oxidoreductase [Pseudomonadota bacterium]|nr:SDR family oxidoreductase [Pseudomonadota bacterium]
MRKPERINLLNSEDKVAFVTGAYGGIGRSVVKMLLESGTKVVATGRSDFRFKDSDVLHLNLDVTKEKEVKSAIEKCISHFGRLDFLIHLAGMVGSGRLDAMSLEEWEKVVSTNLTSAFLILKHGYKKIKKPGGVVILCGSSNGYNGGSHLSGAAYASSKTALVNLVRYCAKEWAPDGIRVNIVSPGPVDTPMLDRLSKNEMDDLRSSLPLGRIASPEECAGSILFLCSNHAESMTGTNLNISSGLVLDA